MTETIHTPEHTESRTSAWLFFLISLAIMLGIFFVATPWFWVALPFVLTYFVKGMNWM
ncbi:MAG: hypothetical protein IPI60_02665 [Saprospiraceae bacterium]|nr:hypothetical protein [Saprospiraceae bacterium]